MVDKIMKDSDRLPDELDLALVDTLQVNARAHWGTVADAVDSTPLTLSRRWQRLTEASLAWSSIALAPGRTLGAVIELRCLPGQERAVAERLAQRPDVITVGITTGDFHVYGLIVSADLRALHHVLLTDATLRDDVLQARFSVFPCIFGGVVWRQGIISRRQSDLVEETAEANSTDLPQLQEADRGLFLALGSNGRRGYQDLAESIGLSTYAVKRRIQRLLRSGDIVFRCDIARPVFGFPIAAFLLLRVPQVKVQQFGRDVGAWLETRFCAPVTAASNIVLIVGTKTIADLDHFLVRVANRYPEAEVVDRRLLLRQIKLYGRMVAADGRAKSVIPVDPWFSSVPGSPTASALRTMLGPRVVG